MSVTERQTICFSETGIGAPTGYVVEVLTDGMTFVIQKIKIRPILIYGSFVVFDGVDLDGNEIQVYSTSGAIIQQAKALLEKYGGKDGTLTVGILCSIKPEKERKQKRKVEGKSEVIKEKWGWKEVPKEPKGYYQLQGRYRFWNTRTWGFASVTGYSTVTKRKRCDEVLQILRSQAIDYAKGRLGYFQSGAFCLREWLLDDIEYEVWLKW